MIIFFETGHLAHFKKEEMRDLENTADPGRPEQVTIDEEQPTKHDLQENGDYKCAEELQVTFCTFDNWHPSRRAKYWKQQPKFFQYIWPRHSPNTYIQFLLILSCSVTIHTLLLKTYTNSSSRAHCCRIQPLLCLTLLLYVTC